MEKSFAFLGKQVIIYADGPIRIESDWLLASDEFRDMLSMFVEHLRKKNSPLLSVFPPGLSKPVQEGLMIRLLQQLVKSPKKDVIEKNRELRPFFRDIYTLSQFVEHFYNHWRSLERFIVCYSDGRAGAELDRRPYRTFNDTIESLNHLLRKTYRDICENITGEHPRIFRQVAAGCQVGVIAAEKSVKLPAAYSHLEGIPFIRQVMLEPPIMFDPPMNSRSGEFQKIGSNPLEGIRFHEGEWLCYPAKICELIVYLYFHRRFTGLGVSLANLFDIADDGDLERKPDAIYAYGLPLEHLAKLGNPPTVFYDDTKNGMVVGAVPGEDRFGYFGYIKKMMLTLHNVSVMKKGRMPVHGAMVRIELKDGKTANLVLWGDTGAGKSETLEGIRTIADQYLRDMTIIFDDMGSLGFRDGEVVAYGTETGAFVRLDDLQPGFALGNLDRIIVHSPYKINARVVIPVTTQKEVTEGHKVDFLLYANNYQHIDKDHPAIEYFASKEKALQVFREGSRIAKGTTGDEKGLVQSFFANIFGPSQYSEVYEGLAEKYFSAMFKSGVRIGQLRTMLGIPGFWTKGPENSAKALFEAISKSK
jgi:hypothetical protein